MENLPPPPPEFTPVPLRARRDGWTPERQYGYIVALAAHGHCGLAARAVGMSPQSAMRLRRRPGAAQFEGLCAAALGMARKRFARIRREALRPKRKGKFSAPGEAET